MKSRVYKGKVFHKRFTPTTHDFHYEMDYLFLALSEIEDVCRLSKLWSKNRFNLISINRQDYLPGELYLDEQVKAEVTSLGGDEFSGEIFLLATPRRIGHCMNPISLFYCYDDEELRYVLAEVHNTPWNERHTYLIEGPDFAVPTAKQFHVSPFMPMDTTYQWNLSDPSKGLHVGISVSRDNVPLFTATMDLVKQELNSEEIANITWRQLTQSFRTFSAIYFQAAKLWRKKVPFFRHPEKSKLQEST